MTLMSNRPITMAGANAVTAANAEHLKPLSFAAPGQASGAPHTLKGTLLHFGFVVSHVGTHGQIIICVWNQARLGSARLATLQVMVTSSTSL